MPANQKNNDRIRNLTSRTVTFGRPAEDKARIAAQISRNVREMKPTRRIGGLSDMDLDRFDDMTPDEIAELENFGG